MRVLGVRHGRVSKYVEYQDAANFFARRETLQVRKACKQKSYSLDPKP